MTVADYVILKQTTMTKDIKDYLHLYLGCECFNHLRLLGVEGNAAYVSHPATGRMVKEIKYLKPILRPLYDMNEEEFIFLANKCFAFDGKECYKQHDAIYIRKNITKERLRLEFDFKAYNNLYVWIDFTEDYKKTFFPLSDIICFINECRKMSFDMDGLIEAGLAIEKNLKTNQS